MAKKTSGTISDGIPAYGRGAHVVAVTTFHALAEELGINRSLLYRWRGQFEATPPIETPELDRRRKIRAKPNSARRTSLLKRALAEKTLEVDFFKGALQKIEARRQRNNELWRDGIYDQIREVMPMQGSLSIERMC